MRDNLHDVDGEHKVNIQEALAEFYDKRTEHEAQLPPRHVFMCGTYQQCKYYMHEMGLGRTAKDRQNIYYVSADRMLNGFRRRPQDVLYIRGTFWERKDCYQLAGSALRAGFTPQELGMEEVKNDGEGPEE